MNPPRLFVTTALHAEARPIIDHFGLEREGLDMPYPIFRGHDMALVVTGIGKVRAAAAAGFLMARSGSHPVGWLNVGVAGHRSFEQGAAFLVNKITDHPSGACFYPKLSFVSPLPMAEVVTVDVPELDFPQDALYDMESSALWQACSAFSAPECIQFLKIVSDNRHNPAERLSRQRVGELIAAHGEALDVVVSELSNLVRAQRLLHCVADGAVRTP